MKNKKYHTVGTGPNFKKENYRTRGSQEPV
jgi:hypothetical protein